MGGGGDLIRRNTGRSIAFLPRLSEWVDAEWMRGQGAVLAEEPLDLNKFENFDFQE